MDFLPWGSNPDQENLRLKVQRLIDDPIIDSPASEPLDGVDSIDIGGGFPGATLEQLAKNCQEWGYFRLLRSIFGVSFRPNDFVSDDGIVHSRNLGVSIRLVFSDQPVWQQEALSPALTTYGVRVIGALELVSETFEKKVIPQIVQMERDLDGDIEALEAYTVLFSVVLLHEYIYRYLRIFQVPSEHIRYHKSTFATATRGVEIIFRSRGRCPSLARRLKLPPSGLYRLLSLGDYEQTHTNCESSHCSAFNITRCTYQVKHTHESASEGEGCHFLPENPRGWYLQLCDIIEKNDIPLVCSTKDKNGTLRIELQSANQSSRYTSISHVWAGGLGNFSANSLPKCRLEEIHNMIDNNTRIPTPDFDPGPLYRLLSAVNKAVRTTSTSKALKSASKSTVSQKLYWLDTLCIPVNPDDVSPCRCPACNTSQPSVEISTQPRSINYTQKAINSMARIYAGAANVLVLDPELQRLQIEERNPGGVQTGLDDYAIALAACSWMARSWTYHEGALAVDTYFKLGNGIKSYSQIREAVEGSDLVDSFLIEPLWQRDILDVQETTVPSSVLTNLLRKVTSSTIRATPPETFANTAEKDLVRFVAVWNDLATRGTMEPLDIAAIMASMLNRSAAEVLHLPVRDRMKALLRSQSLLPASLLFAPRAADISDWVPDFPTSSSKTVLLSKGLRMEWQEDGNLALNTPPNLYLYGASINLDSLAEELVLEVNGVRRKILFCAETSTESRTIKGPVLFWFDAIRDRSKPLLGHAFASTRMSPTGVFYAEVGRSFRWSYIDNAEIMKEEEDDDDGDDTFRPNLFLCPRAKKVSTCKKLVVLVGGMDWPTLSWSRMHAFPFVELGLGLQQASDIAFTATFLLWMFAWAVYPVCYIALFFCPELVERFISPTTSPFFTPRTIQLPLLFTVVRYLVAVLERNFLKRLESRWVQRAWAASFWDSRETYTGGVSDDHVDTWTQSSTLQQELLGRMYPTFAITIIVVLIGAAVFFSMALLGLRQYFDPIPPQYLWSSIFFAIGSAFFDKFWLAATSISCCVLIVEAFLRAAIHFFYLRNWELLVREQKSNRSQGSEFPHGEAIGGRVLRGYSHLLRVALLAYACVLASLSSFLIGSRYAGWGYAGIGLAGFWVLVAVILGFHSVTMPFNFGYLRGRLRPGRLGRGPIYLGEV